MSEDTRASLTGALWFFATLALIALFISAAAQGELTPGHIVLAVVILALAVGATPVILRWKDSEAQPDKAKRQRIDSLLRDMSDEELLELKRRLSDGDLSQEETLDYLGDDGEMVWRR